MKIARITFLVLISFVQNLSSQTFWERLDSWENELSKEQLFLNIEVSMIDQSDLKTVLDQSTIKIIQDATGYYANMFDTEFFGDDELGVQVDHIDQKIVMSSQDQFLMQKERLLKTSAISKLAEHMDIEEILEGNIAHYKLSEREEGKLILEARIDVSSNYVLWMRQHVSRSMEVNGEMKKVVVEMKYDYPSFERKPLLASYITKENGEWKCAASYKSYQLLQN